MGLVFYADCNGLFRAAVFSHTFGNIWQGECVSFPSIEETIKRILFRNEAIKTF